MSSELQPSIPEFFSGKNIFITGATGFLGKALIEKLFRSCPNVGVIYALMRPKKGKDLQERLAQLIKDPLYDRVKKEQPNLKMSEKIIPLAGDVTQLNLGLSAADRQTLVDSVHVVFHVAASVRFDDPLRDAVLMNVRGTREACQLALDARHLVAHVHVSTAFANCDRPEAREVLYPAKIHWEKMIEIAEKFDKYTLSVVTDKFMDGMPNTYCFTKNIAEHVAHDMMNGKKPCKIFRPSIVISSMKEEPVVGWIDNFNGPVGILVAYGKGIMRTIYAHDQYKPDYIPVDVVTKALVVSTWDMAVKYLPPKPRVLCVPEVLQCTSHDVDWLRPSVEHLAASAYASNEITPLNDVLWVTSKHTTSSTFVWYVRTVLFMLMPALMLDGLLKLLGKKPMVTKLQKKMFVAQLALRHFMTNEWVYSNDNLKALLDRIQPNDKDDWDYEFRGFDFREYMNDALLGCRRYLLNEPDNTLPQARRHYYRMKIINRVVQLVMFGLLCWFMWNFDVVQYGFQKIRL